MPLRKTIHYVRLEEAVLHASARHITQVAYHQGRVLADVGHEASDAIAELMFRESPEQLRARATRIRSAVLHALTVIAELQAQAGSLEHLASVREALEPASDE